MENLLIKLLITLDVWVFKSNLLVREEHEVMNQNLCCFLECILWVDGTIRANLDDELIVVCLLLYAVRLNSELNITDWGVDRINCDNVDISPC